MWIQLSKGLLHLLLFPPQNQSFWWWCYKSMLIWSNQFCRVMKDIHTMCSFTLQTRNQLKQGASSAGLTWSGLSRSGDRSRQQTVSINALGMKFGLRRSHEARLEAVGGGKLGDVSVLSDRCVTVQVSLACLAYMLPMSISHAGVGRAGDGGPCEGSEMECSYNRHPKDTLPPTVTYYRALAIKSLSFQLRIS